MILVKILTPLLVGLFFFSCSKNAVIEDSDIVGKWKLVELKGKPVDESRLRYMVIKADHSLIGINIIYGKKEESNGTWQLIKNKDLTYLYMTYTKKYRDYNERWIIDMEGDNLALFEDSPSRSKALFAITDEN